MNFIYKDHQYITRMNGLDELNIKMFFGEIIDQVAILIKFLTNFSGLRPIIVPTDHEDHSEINRLHVLTLKI